VVDSSGDGAKEMLQEAAVMAQVGGHPNLVSLIGVVTSGTPILLIISFCEKGSLLSVLENRASLQDPISVASKLRFSVQIAEGMLHLASIHFIHRDLAARNILVDSEFSAKVADFGLSRGTGGPGGANGEGGGNYYRSSNGLVALRWTAPEAMEHLKFTTASDVWYVLIAFPVFDPFVRPHLWVGLRACVFCVCARERESVCVCVCERERERERERECSKQELGGQHTLHTTFTLLRNRLRFLHDFSGVSGS
jgi:serine/threonine protein kinase